MLKYWFFLKKFKNKIKNWKTVPVNFFKEWFLHKNDYIFNDSIKNVDNDFLVFQKKIKKLINILKIKKSYFNKYFENIDQIITDGLSSLKLYVLFSIKLKFILVWSIVIIRSFCVEWTHICHRQYANKIF